MTGQVYEYFIQGGIFMWPILLFSLIALTVIIERFIVFHKAKINVNEFLTKIRKALLVNRNVKEAIKVCEQYRGPVASVIKAGLLRYGHDREDIEKTIENAALYELDRLERRLGDPGDHRQRRADARLPRDGERHDQVLRHPGHVRACRTRARWLPVSPRR